MLITFTFVVNQTDGEAVFAGNITASEALQVLTQLVIAEAVKNATANAGEQSQGLDKS